MWQSAGEEEKAPFKAMAKADKDRYLGELEAHNYRWGRLLWNFFCRITACLIGTFKMRACSSSADLPLPERCKMCEKSLHRTFDLCSYGIQ